VEKEERERDRKREIKRKQERKGERKTEKEDLCECVFAPVSFFVCVSMYCVFARRILI